MFVWIIGALLVLGIGMISYAFSHPRVVHAPEIVDVEQQGPSVHEEAIQSTTLELGLNQPLRKDGWTATAVRVIEDSRCPSDVECIRAGTVRIGVTLQELSGEQVLTLGERTPLADGIFATLVSVVPEKVSTTPTPNSSYRFTLLLERP